jgi:hypothetical protein
MYLFAFAKTQANPMFTLKGIEISIRCALDPPFSAHDWTIEPIELLAQVNVE